MSVSAISHDTYAQHRQYVLGVLARRCGWLDRAEHESLYHDAYVVLLEKERAGELRPEHMRPAQVRAYLTQTALYKALDEGKSAERTRTAPLDDAALAEPELGDAPEDRTALDFDRARVREIVADLPERRQAIVKLRFFFDRTPAEIISYLGVTERVYRRELERAMRQLADRYELVREGRFCESRRSVILAYVAGIAGPNRARDARRHLADCPACTRWAADMREATRQAAAVLPLPALALASGRSPGRLGELVQAVRDLFAGGKQHAAELATRLDPTTAHYAAAARPGFVTAAVAGCLAVGGGVTYCVETEVPKPVRSLFSHVSHQHRHRSSPRRAPVKAAGGPALPSATPPTSRPTRRTTAHKAPTHTTTKRRASTTAHRAATTAAAAHQFGFENGSSSQPASKPPARPAGGSGGGAATEFGP